MSRIRSFKVGDRVVSIGSCGASPMYGIRGKYLPDCHGTVIHINSVATPPILVKAVMGIAIFATPVNLHMNTTVRHENLKSHSTKLSTKQERNAICNSTKKYLLKCSFGRRFLLFPVHRRRGGNPRKSMGGLRAD